MQKQLSRQCRSASVASLALLALSAVGCQVDIGGQTLPSPWYQSDDIQYFAPHSEFQLPREAAAQKAFSQDQALQAGGVVAPVPIVPGIPGAVPPGVAVPIPGEVAPVPVEGVPVVPVPPDAAPDALPPDAGVNDLNPPVPDVEGDAFAPDAPEPGVEADMGF